MALLLAAGAACAQDPASAYLDASRAEALRFAPGGARIVRSALGALPNDGRVVCGIIEVAGEPLPFATIWDPDRRADRGATLVGLTARDRKTRRHGGANHAAIRSVCVQAGLGKALPRAP
ncbi:MAG: hypothetical protein DI570_22060 [Phenylobacterium zucineum]|nr:MAG: hypothetical protein DI570_22060 [Phenylobacterium zucineum]